MNGEIPLGQSENQHLEFKSSDVLRHLASVGREVVAMLNSEGGDVWIGLRESAGVAVSVEAIQNADREIGRLRDHFSDSIEPAPDPQEIKYDKVETPGVGFILRLRIQPVSDLGPRALRDGVARLFLRRVGDRVRPMSHEEMMRKFTAKHRQGDPSSDAKRKILEARDRWLGKGGVLWLRIQPIADLELDLDSEEDLRKYFVNPLVTGNRAAGWNFVNPYERVRRQGDAVIHGQDEGSSVRVYRDGGVEFILPIENLYWKSASGRPESDAKEIWPFSLLEFPISVFRLASTIYTDHALQRLGPVLADLALFGLQGWTLRPHSPRSFGYRLHSPAPFDEENLLLPKPLTFQRDEILHKADRCGFRLVKQVYERFGYWEKEIPEEFDRESGRLIFPNE
jgi:hypothetical protein